MFDDDVAADVADTWNGPADRPAEATRAVYAEWEEAIEDVDDGPVVFFALASLQLDAQALDGEVKERALAAIGPNMRRWEEESSPDDAEQRRAVLEELRGRMLRLANPS